MTVTAHATLLMQLRARPPASPPTHRWYSLRRAGWSLTATASMGARELLNVKDW